MPVEKEAPVKTTNIYRSDSTTNEAIVFKRAVIDDVYDGNQYIGVIFLYSMKQGWEPAYICIKVTKIKWC